MAAHASQIPSDSFFLTLPPEVFAEAIGKEFFVLRRAKRDALEKRLI